MCNHDLGFLSDMQTISVGRDSFTRKCQVCGELETLLRAGKLYTGYSIEAESKRDFERREYAKDLLQPKDKKGNTNELFDHAYGNPYKKAKVGTDVEKYRIKGKRK